MIPFWTQFLGLARGAARVILLRRQPDPTDDIYIEGPLRMLVRERRIALQIVNFSRGWSRRALLAGGVLVISRYIEPALLDFIREHRGRFRKIVYLFDDDLGAVRQTQGLPQAYKDWILPFAEGPFRELLELADTLVVTSPHLLDRYPASRTRLLEPVFYLGEVGAGHLDHHRDLNTIRIVCSLTSTHQFDLAAIAPALGALLDRYPQVRLTVIGAPPPPELARRPGVLQIPQRPWRDYKRLLARTRAHLSLAPLLDTPWNMGKSMIKLIDAVQMGAAPVFSDVAPYRRLIDDGIHGVLAANDPAVWLERLSDLVEHPERLRGMAAHAQHRALELASPARARAFWLDLLS